MQRFELVMGECGGDDRVYVLASLSVGHPSEEVSEVGLEVQPRRGGDEPCGMNGEVSWLCIAALTYYDLMIS